MMKAVVPLLLSLSLAAPAWAGDGHDRARRGMLRGDLLPLERILEQADRDFPGELIEAELEEKDDRPVYEIKRLTTDGRLLKIYYDAADGSRIKVKEKAR